MIDQFRIIKLFIISIKVTLFEQIKKEKQQDHSGNDGSLYKQGKDG